MIEPRFKSTHNRQRAAHILALSLLLIFVLAACGGEDEPDEPPEPVSLLTDAADNIRAADTFRLDVSQTGAPYQFAVILPGEGVSYVEFRRARAQYVAPERLQASVRVIAAGLPIDIDIFSAAERQWFKVFGLDWINEDFAPGFDPVTLIAEDSGFQAALAALTDLEYIGVESLEDGTGVYHLRGTARGPDVTNLLVGLIEAEGLVPVDVYIDRNSIYPVRLIITQPETATEDEPEPTTWTIDVYDVDAAPDLTPPEGA